MSMDESVRNHMGELGLALCEARTLLKARDDELKSLKEFIAGKMLADQTTDTSADHKASQEMLANR